MAEDTKASTKPSPQDAPGHALRFLIIWAVLAIAADLFFWFVVGPHTPPGTMTSTAEENQFDLNVLAVMAIPVLIGVWTYLIYAIIVWRDTHANASEPKGGAAARGHMGAQVAWISITSVLVLFLAGFGTYELIDTHGAGGGEGPIPVWSPDAKNPLVVQVIGQQWKFTYRYPSFGGMSSDILYLPANTPVTFHVTSLDVIHNFWAYQLSVKADANPGFDNVAFTETRGTGQFMVRCNELCGLWHGAMWKGGAVLSRSAFEHWATTYQAATAANTALLPPFAWTYIPDANGANGNYYPDGTATPYSPLSTYGATQAKI